MTDFKDMTENLRDPRVSLTAFNVGMLNARNFKDREVAESYVKALARNFPEIITHLPSEVGSIIVETNGGEIEIVREDLDATYEQPPDKIPVPLTWKDAFALLVGEINSQENLI